MRLFRGLFRGGARRAEEIETKPAEDVPAFIHADISDLPAADDAPANVGDLEPVQEAVVEESAEVLMLHGGDRVLSEPSPEFAPIETPAAPAVVEEPEEPKAFLGEAEVGTEAASPFVAPAPAGHEEDPSVRRPRPKKGRVKTRLLGFDEEPASTVDDDPVAGEPKVKNPVGWIVVVDGPGAGEWFTLNGGLASIGRGDDQTIRLDFGDMAISRSNHAALAYDNTDHVFLLGDGGKANSVLVNGTPTSGTAPVKDGDLISIGETTLRLVALCSKSFNWQPKAEGGTNNVGYA